MVETGRLETLSSIWEILDFVVTLLLAILILWYVISKTQDDGIPNTVELRLTNIENSMRSVQEFTVRLDSSPQFRGKVGEDVVRTRLAELPPEYVIEQYSGSDIPGRPDFVILLPNVPEKLIIDAKMSFPDEKMHEDKFRNILRKRSDEITKYIVPGVTFDFVLMWIPDSAYSMIDNKLARHFFQSGVVPVTTPNMISVIHLLRRAHRAFRLNALTSKFVTFHSDVSKQVIDLHSTMDKSNIQLRNGLKNFEVANEKIYDVLDTIENFEETIDLK